MVVPAVVGAPVPPCPKSPVAGGLLVVLAGGCPIPPVGCAEVDLFPNKLVEGLEVPEAIPVVGAPVPVAPPVAGVPELPWKIPPPEGAPPVGAGLLVPNILVPDAVPPVPPDAEVPKMLVGWLPPPVA